MDRISYIIETRCAYGPQSSLGKITLTNEERKNIFHSYSLADTVRPKGIKVYGATAIPENLLGYKVKKTYSNRFKRLTLQIYTEEGDLSLKANGISFTGVRNHGGNDHEDTEGCPLTAYNLLGVDENGDFIVQGRSDLDLILWFDREIEKDQEVRWVVINLDQTI